MVIVVPFQRINDSRYNPVAPENSPAGYSDVLWTQNESSCSSSTCLRPTGFAWHPDSSRMYIGSDESVGEFTCSIEVEYNRADRFWSESLRWILEAVDSTEIHFQTGNVYD